MNTEDKMWMIASHLGAVIGGFIVPMVIWLWKNEESDEVAEHARVSLNFQLSIVLYLFVAYVLSYIYIGTPFLYIIPIFNLVCIILATVKANDEELFNYPLSFHFFK